MILVGVRGTPSPGPGQGEEGYPQSLVPGPFQVEGGTPVRSQDRGTDPGQYKDRNTPRKDQGPETGNTSPPPPR